MKALDSARATCDKERKYSNDADEELYFKMRKINGLMIRFMDLGPRNEVRERAVCCVMVRGQEGDGNAFVSWIKGQSTYLMTT